MRCPASGSELSAPLRDRLPDNIHFLNEWHSVVGHVANLSLNVQGQQVAQQW
jgi:hypothetical protein